MQRQYVFIESRDPFDSPDTVFVADTAAALHRGGRPVTVFLVQNGVLSSRAAARGSHVPRLAAAGVTVLAENISLRERGIEASDLSAGVRPASIDTLVDLAMRPDTRVLWH